MRDRSITHGPRQKIKGTERNFGWIKDRLGTAAVKGRALDPCQELFLSDGAHSDEEEAVLLLRKLLE